MQSTSATKTACIGRYEPGTTEFHVNNDEPYRLETTCGDLGLRVSFHWTGDRFAHTVWACFGQQAVPLLRSVEGTGDENWPASPPIQQVNCPCRDGQPTAILGMGMAGRSHWSLSIEASVDPQALVFDVACRPGGELGKLASGYQTFVSSTGQAGDDVVVLEHSSRRFQIQTISADSSANSSLDCAGQSVAVLVHANQRTGAKTFRWKYRVAIDSAM